MLSTLRKVFVLGGLSLIVTQSDASPSTTPDQNFKNNTKNELEYQRNINRIIENISITYEEWKAAVENPDSESATKFRVKSRLILKNGEEVYSSFIEEEKQEFNNFWKTFNFDIEKAKSNADSKEESELFNQYIFPTLLDIQTDLVHFYDGHQFNFAYPSIGEKILIRNHIRFGLKYASEGKKRKTYMGEKLEKLK